MINQWIIRVKRVYKKLMVSDNFEWQRAANDHSMRSGCHGRDCMVVRFTTTCAIKAYHH